MTAPWPQDPLGATGIVCGPWAWTLGAVLGPDADRVAERPSLVVVGPGDEDAALERAAAALADWPVLLVVDEPAFARRLRPGIEQRLAALCRERVEALMMRVDEPPELKSGSMLQTLFELRDTGRVGAIGLAHDEARSAEWLATQTAARLLGVNYGLHEQSARYRALGAAAEHGMAPVGLRPPDPGDREAVRFALGEAARVLPVLSCPPPADLSPMRESEVASAWSAWRAAHPEPEPLPRGRPPAGGEG